MDFSFHHRSVFYLPIFNLYVLVAADSPCDFPHGIQKRSLVLKLYVMEHLIAYHLFLLSTTPVSCHNFHS